MDCIYNVIEKLYFQNTSACFNACNLKKALTQAMIKGTPCRSQNNVLTKYACYCFDELSDLVFHLSVFTCSVTILLVLTRH